MIVVRDVERTQVGLARVELRVPVAVEGDLVGEQHLGFPVELMLAHETLVTSRLVGVGPLVDVGGGQLGGAAELHLVGG